MRVSSLLAILIVFLFTSCSSQKAAEVDRSNNVERIRLHDTLYYRDSVIQKETTEIRYKGDTIIINKYIKEREVSKEKAAFGRDTFYMKSDTIVKYYPANIKGDNVGVGWVILSIIGMILLVILVKKKPSF